jgi:ferredoxin/flavodoxin
MAAIHGPAARIGLNPREQFHVCNKRGSTMSFIRLLMRRRNFLAGSASAALGVVFGRTAGIFGLLSQTSFAEALDKTQPIFNKKLKGIVVYYSATGNTAQVANAIYKGMKSVITCDVVPITKMDPKKMAKYDVVAIGAPNWYMRVPANVLKFIYDMPRMDGKHGIVFGTHGGGGPSMFWVMSRNLLKKGMTIIGWSDWSGTDMLTPHNCVPDAGWGHPDLIDLAEAEAFGKRIAEHSVRIHAGETELIPEVPKPELGGDSLFSPNQAGEGKIGFSGGAANGTPRLDLTKCVYPRCTQCAGNCPVNAIDFSVLTAAGSATKPGVSTVSPIVLKEACQRCGGLCERVCHYDAIAYIGTKGVRVFQKIHLDKCTYPKCTACMDNCPQEAIDVSKNPPVIHNRCENEALCFGVCPQNAIETTPTSLHIDEGAGTMQSMVPTTGGPGNGGGTSQGQAVLTAPGGAGEMPVNPRFRSLIKDSETCTKGHVVDLTVYPRIPINKKLWPYHVEES